MDINQVAKLLNSVGEFTSCQNNCIKEDEAPYENYYKLEKNGNKWEYGLYMQERQNTPHFKVIKEFHKEEEGAKYFLLARLSSYYFKKKVQPFVMNHNELDIGGDHFNESKLYQSMSLLGIPSTFFVTDRSQIQHRAILLTKKDHTKSIVSFVDYKGNMIHSTVPINHQRALFITFKKVYMLYLFETEVSKLLKTEGLEHDVVEREINIFLS